MTTDTTNLKHKSFLFSKACSSSCVSHPGQYLPYSPCHPTAVLRIAFSSLNLLWTQSLVLLPRLNDPSCAHYSEYHSISSGLSVFLLKMAITVCKPCLPRQVWVLLIHSHYAAWESLVKYKPQYVSSHCLQNEVPTYQTGMPSLTRFLPSIPDPSLGASTPPLVCLTIEPHKDVLLTKAPYCFPLSLCMSGLYALKSHS